MDLSKLQVIALCVLTTILTDKFLINHGNGQNLATPLPTPVTTVTPVATASANNSSQDEIILRELINIRKEMMTNLTDLKKQSSVESGVSVPATASSLLGGMVKISSPQWKRIDVYEKPLASSKIISSIVYDTIYFYRQKQTDWYQLDLDGGQLGWVQSQFLKEFP